MNKLMRSHVFGRDLSSGLPAITCETTMLLWLSSPGKEMATDAEKRRTTCRRSRFEFTQRIVFWGPRMA